MKNVSCILRLKNIFLKKDIVNKLEKTLQKQEHESFNADHLESLKMKVGNTKIWVKEYEIFKKY